MSRRDGRTSGSGRIFRGRAVPGRVTVIVPFRNREQFLAEAVRSILNQTHSDTQLILADDGSTDRSLAVARSFRDPRCLLVRLRRAGGKARAINRVLPLAQGEWISFFDSDDFMMPRSLEVRVRFLKRHPGSLAVMGRVGRIIDESGEPIPKNHPLQVQLRGALQEARQLCRWIGSLNPEMFVFGECPLSPLSATLFRREAVERLGYLDGRFSPWEDREYLSRLAVRKAVPFLDRAVMRYRVHQGNASFRVRRGRLFHPRETLLAERLKARYWELSRNGIG